MKRCYLGAAVLLGILILGFFTSRWMQRHYNDLENRMEEAMWEDPETLMALAEEIRQDWSRGQLLTAVLADHQHLEEVEAAFSQLGPAAARRDQAEYTRLCLEIAHIFQLLAEEQQLNLKNLL